MGNEANQNDRDAQERTDAAPNELFLERVLQILPFAAYTCNAEGLITYCNPRAVRLWGRTPKLNDSADRYCGSFKLFAPDGSPVAHAQCGMAQALERDCEFHGREIAIERPDGGRLRAIEHASPIHDEAGKLIGGINILLDMTERKGAEPPIGSGERQFAAFMAHLPGLAWIKDLDGQYVFVNDAAEHVFGRPREQIYGRTDTDIFPPQTAAQFQENDRRALAASEGIQAVELLEHDDGIVHVSIVSKFPILGPDGTAAMIGGMAIDITEWKQVELALQQTQAQYQSLVEHLPINLFTKDPAGRFTYANHRFVAMRGKSIQELVGKTDFDIYPNELAERYRRDDQLVMESRQPLDQEEENQSPDGCKRHVQVLKVPLTDSLGQVSGIQGVFWDITDRKRAEEALRESETFLRMSQQAGHCGSWEWELATNRVRWSDEMCRIHGIEPSQFGGTLEAAVAYVHPDDQGRLRDGIGLLLDKHVFTDMEYRIIRPDGKELTLWGRGTILFDAAGRVERVIGTSTDVTERKQSEEERRGLAAQIQHAQKLESLGVLAGGIAHDFNNLLTSVMGYASLALMQLPDESVACPMLREIEKAAQRAADLTSQMLAYSGRGKFVIQVVRLDTLVHEMTKLLGTVVSKKALLHLELQAATVDGDATQIRQVVMNLITNASDALEGNVGTISVRTGVVQAAVNDLRSPYTPDDLSPGAYAFVEVEDNGCGMKEETLAKLFDPFYTTKFAGRGLGLAAVLGIVRGHKGTIKVESAPGRGTRCIVLLPSSSASGMRTVNDEGEAATTRGRGLVLIVEDEPVVRQFARQVLESAGFAVCEASDGHEGLATFAERRDSITAVILDLTMPGMDGLELLRELREMQPDVPALVMSGYSEAEVATRFAGLDVGFIHKPFHPNELVERICRLLSSESGK